MAKIVDPDDISYVVDSTAAGSDEMEIQTGAKTIQLLAQGTLSDNAPGATSGVSGKCLYSKLKEISIVFVDLETIGVHQEVVLYYPWQ